MYGSGCRRRPKRGTFRGRAAISRCKRSRRFSCGIRGLEQTGPVQFSAGRDADEQREKRLGVKRDKRPQIRRMKRTLHREQDNDQRAAGDQPGRLEQRDRHEQQQAHDAVGHRQLVVGCREHAERRERNVQNDLIDKQTDFHRDFADQHGRDQTHRRRQRRRGVHRREPHQIDAEFRHQNLPEQRNVRLLGRADKIERTRQQLRFHDEQKPGRQQKQRNENTEKPHPPQISAHERRLPVFLRVLHEMEKRRRQNHHARRRIDKHDDMALQQMAGDDVRTLGVPHLRVRVPVFADDDFFQLLVRQRNAVDLDLPDFVLHVFHEVKIGDVVNVGDAHFGLGTFAHHRHFELQPRIAQPAADEGHIGQQRFRKSVAGAAHDPFQARLFDAADGILLDVHDDRLFFPFDEQRAAAHHHFQNRVRDRRHQFDLNVRDILFKQFGQRTGNELPFVQHGEAHLDHRQHLILGKPVQIQQTRRFFAERHFPKLDVKARIQPELFLQGALVVLHTGGNGHHVHPFQLFVGQHFILVIQIAFPVHVEFAVFGFRAAARFSRRFARCFHAAPPFFFLVVNVMWVKARFRENMNANQNGFKTAACGKRSSQTANPPLCRAPSREAARRCARAGEAVWPKSEIRSALPSAPPPACRRTYRTASRRRPRRPQTSRTAFPQSPPR